jgi:GNAT superfamily N-acetyltransferase
VTLSAKAVSVQDIVRWRDLYRHEMNCQIIHDSLHAREGWTQSYLLLVDDAAVGYGSTAISGPWKGKPTIFEFYILPQYRCGLFDIFSTLLEAAGTTSIETQTNDALLSNMLHALALTVTSESILFHDKITTAHAPPGAVVRRMTSGDAAQILSHQLEADAEWVLEVEGRIAGTGGILYHYNRPYGDIYMRIAEPFRRRGFGSYLVQELKRICYEQGSVPAARCNPTNIASRRTLQKAGFVPCGIRVTGSVAKLSD